MRYDLRNVNDVLELIKEEGEERYFKQNKLPCVILRNKEFGTLDGYIGIDPNSEYYKYFKSHNGSYCGGYKIFNDFTYNNYDDTLDIIADVDGYFWRGFHCHHKTDMVPYRALNRDINFTNKSNYKPMYISSGENEKANETKTNLNIASKIIYKLMPGFIKNIYEDIVQEARDEIMPPYRDMGYVMKKLEKIASIISGESKRIKNRDF